MIIKLYDVASLALAEHFMEDHPQGITADNLVEFTDDLAKHIQQAVEDWFEERGRTR